MKQWVVIFVLAIVLWWTFPRCKSNGQESFSEIDGKIRDNLKWCLGKSQNDEDCGRVHGEEETWYVYNPDVEHATGLELCRHECTRPCVRMGPSLNAICYDPNHE